MSDFIDFGKIEEEENKKIEEEKEAMAAAESFEPSGYDGLMDDLLSTIEKEDVEELKLDKVSERGIQNDDQADYYVGRILDLEKEIEDINTIAEKKIKEYTDKVTEWKDKVLKSPTGAHDYIQSLLEDYTRKRTEGLRKNSVALVNGTIGFRKTRDKFDVDEDKLRKYLDETGKTKFLENQPSKVKWGEFKKTCHLGADGILRDGDTAVPGVVVTRRPDTFYVK